MRLRRLATVTVSTAVLVVPLLGAVAQAAPAQEGLQLVVKHESLLATHEWYAQTWAGHKVIGGWYARHVDRKTGQATVSDGTSSTTTPLAGC